MARRRKNDDSDGDAHDAVRRIAQAQIRQFPDPVLRSKSRAIDVFDNDLEALSERMIGLADDASGAGLAAPQIGLLRSLVVINFDEEEPWIAMANPQVVAYGAETQVAGEGCLSLDFLLRDGYSVPVERSIEVTIRWQDLQGEVHTRTLQDMSARIFQHEVDHLDGILTIDRAEPEARREAMRRLRLRERIT